MPVNKQEYQQLVARIKAANVTLVAVSKTKSVQEIQELYDLGQRDFGENYVQELTEKQAQLPPDVRWHFIGHLQSNKVKQIAPFVELIQSVDSIKLLQEINKQAKKNNRVIDCLLQVHIAQEETKFGFDERELVEALKNVANSPLDNIRITGLMGMASFTNDSEKIRSEFRNLSSIFKNLLSVLNSSAGFNNNSTSSSSRLSSDSHFTVLSCGMSSDFEIAIEEGSNMVRIGSLIFGQRN